MTVIGFAVVVLSLKLITLGEWRTTRGIGIDHC